ALAQRSQLAQVAPEVCADVGVEGDTYAEGAGALDRAEQGAPSRPQDVARRPAMEPPCARHRRPPHVDGRDELVGAMGAARGEERAVPAPIEGDEPDPRARVAGEAQARLDAFRPQLARQQASEL